ncbi:MAG TPA: ATP-binding protein [Micromonosporaceae bacterium]|jgi:hypothetical protein
MIGTDDLRPRLAEYERRIAVAVAARRHTDERADDPFRGLYLPDEAIDALLTDGRGPITGVLDHPSEPPAGRLADLGRRAGLTGLDVDLLLIALAPDVDSRFEQFYGYLNDDVTRRRATVGLALRLAGLPESAIAGRTRLDTGAPLRTAALLVVEEVDRPLLSRTLRVPDRVVAHLLGDDRIDAGIAGVADVEPAVPIRSGDGAVEQVRAALAAGVDLVHIRQRPGSGARDLALRGAQAAGFAAVHVEANRLHGTEAGPALVREALLRGAVLTIGPLAVSASEGETPGTPPVRTLRHPGVPLVTYGPEGWDPAWSDDAPLEVDAPVLTPSDRAALWREHMAGRLAADDDPAAATAHFVLDPHQIARAAQAAIRHALASSSAPTGSHLRAGARSQNASGLARLARRIAPTVTMDDLVLPQPVLLLLGELAARARHRDLVLDEWRMRPGGGRGRGVAGLFAGDPGTGKTMSAEAVAGVLGMDLYTVNLASVVSKYIGETEKNLERIFTEAAGINGVLLFDEADAIFGKRSEVKDAHDRYANVESAYLLQRMETFDGIALLATNLRANLDEAFTRRLDVVVDFPLPDADLRERLWDRCLGPNLPRTDDIDLRFLATAFELAGGHIRSAAITAAYLAAQQGRPVSMLDLVGAVAREYRKLGRLTLDTEFGDYLAALPT